VAAVDALEVEAESALDGGEVIGEVEGEAVLFGDVALRRLPVGALKENLIDDVILKEGRSRAGAGDGGPAGACRSGT
jgi:hypothetical protein